MALDSHKTALLVIDVQNEYQKQGERRKEGSPCQLRAL